MRIQYNLTEDIESVFDTEQILKRIQSIKDPKFTIETPKLEAIILKLHSLAQKVDELKKKVDTLIFENMKLKESIKND